VTAGRYRLGAEELLELGRARATPADRRPFLMGRARPMMANERPSEQVYIFDILGSVAGFLADGLSFAFTTLGDLIDIPLQILSQGVDIAFNGIAGLLQQIPIVGDLLAQIVVLGGSLIKFALSIPGLVLRGLGNILGGVAKALKGSGTEKENQEKVDGAKDKIVDGAPSALKDNVKAILNASGVTGKDLAPSVSPTGEPKPTTITPTTKIEDVTPPAEGVEIGTVLAVGVPVVGALALIVALAT